jgi:rhodanese-related sulfurtransferase
MLTKPKSHLLLTVALLLLGVWLVGPVPVIQAEEEKAFKEFHEIVDVPLVLEVVELKKPGLIIDARPKNTLYDTGHIPGAISMPMSRFDDMKHLLPADKNALIIYYCQGVKCALSHKAAYISEEMGYKNVKVYAKGYPEWKELYGPGPGDPDLAAKVGTVLVIDGQKAEQVMKLIKDAGLDMAEAGPEAQGPFKAVEGAVHWGVFEEIYKKDSASMVLVDVRDPEEFNKGHFKEAINMTVDQLEEKLADWKPEKPVVFVCGTGARSGEAYYMLKDQAPKLEAYFVDGELTFTADGKYVYTPSK